MAQQISDDFHRHCTAQQTDGSRESEGVRTMASLNLDAGLFEPMRDDTVKRGTSAKRAERRPRMQEDLAEFGLGPSPPQIVQQRIAVLNRPMF